jgi:hypothetical protein
MFVFYEENVANCYISIHLCCDITQKADGSAIITYLL